MKFRLALLITVLVPVPAAANYCAAPLSRTNETINGIVNSYYPITADITFGAPNVITIGNREGAAADLRVGDLILFWAHQRAQIDAIANTDAYGSGDLAEGGRGFLDGNDTGKFQWLRVAGLNGATGTTGDVVRASGAVGDVNITVMNGGGGGPFTLMAITGLGATMAGSGQIIRVPQYGNATISGTVTALPFHNTQTSGISGPQGVGGIVALDVAGTLTFGPGAQIDVDGLGFRGGAGQRFNGRAGFSATNYALSPFSAGGDGTVGAGGIKGEGIAGTPRRIITIDTGTVSEQDFTGTAGVSVDGYGTTTTPAAWGKGAPGNAGGGATDQCPLAAAGLSNTMCRYVGSGTLTTYTFGRLNPGGGGGGGNGNGGTGGGLDNDGSAGAQPVNGGGIGGRGINTFAKFPDDPIPGGFHQIAVMGGGGGAGSTNAVAAGPGDTVAVGELQSSGAAGGGVVLIRTGTVAGTGSITANGSNAFDVTALDTEYPIGTINGGTTQGNGGGGGGGGGWILVAARQASTPSLSLSARGGDGGDSSGGMGAGGGGGGGFAGVSSTISGASFNVSGGSGGSSTGTTTPIAKATAMALANNSVLTGAATAGAAGSTLTSFTASALSVPAGTADAGNRAITSSSVAPGPQCVPYVQKEFSDDGGATWEPAITMAKDAVFKMRLRIENSNEDAFLSGSVAPQAFDDLAFTDTYPANVFNAPTPNLTHNGCGSPSITAAAGGSSLAVSGNASIAGETTCTITVDLRAGASGMFTNTIPAEGVTVTQLKDVGGAPALTLRSYENASASVTVPTGLGATKSSIVVSDPINDTTNPKRIPGALVDYTVAIDNPGGILDADTMILTDALPSTMKLFVGDLVGGAPYEFTASTSNLTCPFTALNNMADCVAFSTDGVDFTYVPTPGPDGTDASVRHVRFSTTGSMAASSDFSVRYRLKLN